ncbi:MAG: hypothetical protein ACK4F9_06350 [Brevinematia bacterium]
MILKKEPTEFSWFKLIIVNILVSAIVAVLALFVYTHKFAAPRISIVDLSGYLIGLRNLYLQGKITEDEAKKKIDEAVGIIQERAKNRIVLSAEVVLGKNSKVEVINLPQLPASAYNFDINEFLKKYGEKAR